MTYGIGKTSLIRAKYIEQSWDIDELYLKLEGENPTGTHKDRLAIQHVDDAIIRNHDTITVGSCGNYGVAMSFVACKSKLNCKVFVPKKYTGNHIKQMKDYGSEVFRIEGGYEESVEKSRAMAEKNDWYDANPGNKNTPISMVAYVDIADEIQQGLDETPKTISVPVGNGTTLAGIHLGFRLLWRKNRSKDIPIMLAASSRGNNAIIETISKDSREVLELNPEDIIETEINEPLLNWRSLDGQEAVNAIYDTGGIGVGLTDDEMTSYRKLLEEDGIKCLPASAAALGALEEYLKKNEKDGKHVVVVTSGVKNVC